MKFQASFGATHSHQSPYFMSNLDKYHGTVFLDDASILEIIRGSTFTIPFMDYCGASLVVLLLTDVCLISFILIPKERSRMNQNG